MNSSHSDSGPRRRSRGGRSRSSSSRPPRSGDNFKVTREPRKPAGLWDKIKAFFGLAPQPARPSANGSGRSERSERSERPARRERSRDESRESRSPREPREDRESRETRAPRESRKPENIEVTTPRLYIGNLSYDAAESDLLELFSGVGTVANVEVISNKHTQRSKGFGFIQMNSVSEAKRAVEELHDKEYLGRKLVVSGAKLPPDRAIGRDRDEDAPSAESASEESAAQV
jgi:RNA recognition motif-containing protein